MSESTGKQIKPDPFDLVRSPLKGFNLIDASAGTGKTYTICGLVLRLLLEQDLTINQILVVTYTEAATEDLRDRIRQKLRQALDLLTTGRGDDPFLAEYLERLQPGLETEKKINDALRGFDEAAIFTIHSFCHRQLLENSFESNTLFDAELVADDSYIVREIVEDFWRVNFYQGSPLFTEHVRQRLTPQKLSEFLAPFLPRPFLQFIPEIEPEKACAGYSEAEAEFIQVYRNVCKVWQSDGDRVADDLRHSGALKRNIYRQDRVEAMLDDMEALAAAGRPGLRLPDTFAYFTASRIAGAVKKNAAPSLLQFYEICENLLQLHSGLLDRYNMCLLAMKRRLACSFRDELARRKEKENIFSFDDLLLRLHRGFTGPGGCTFAGIVAQKYPAILIDEFQDTDPLQFDIFSALHRAGSLLFLIGDPKQAIYSFRGADIFTYMAAAVSGPLSHYTLGINHRSTPELIKAVNTLFGGCPQPFIFEAISFQTVAAACKNEAEQLTFDGRQQEPFVLWHLNKLAAGLAGYSPDASDQERLTKASARRIAIAAVAAEVTRLLDLAADNRVCIKNRRLQPGDIAVLVRRNIEARKMQEALAACRVPSVVHSTDNLFESREAKELVLLLKAIASPHDRRLLRTALLTRLIGMPASEVEIYGPAADKVIGRWQTRFKTYHRLWVRSGFIGMFWAFMAENRTRARMLSLENGERILTNILHLGEILHQEAEEQDLNVTTLLGYLQGRLAERQDKNPEHQLRLESDADRVKIVTIHKAKGLEYPVVFCPFTWDGTRLDRGRECIFHRQDHEAGAGPVYDGGSPDLEKHLQLARTEELAENLRLLYVAVTRGVHRCYLAWGMIKEAETSAPAYLLHQGSSLKPDSAVDRKSASLMARAAARYPTLSEAEFRTDLENLAAASAGTIRLLSEIEPGTTVGQSAVAEINGPLTPRKVTSAIAVDWKISSFSSLTASRTPAEIVFSITADISPGLDESPPLEAGEDMVEDVSALRQASYDVFSLPPGTGTGIMLHEILEQVDFSGSDQTATDALVDAKLLSHGFEPAWKSVITGMLADLARVALHPDIAGLTLGAVPAVDCLRELEFYFPLAGITPARLQKLFRQNVFQSDSSEGTSRKEQQLGRLTFAPARGFMRGFIDLVFAFRDRFYLVDWKSNYLGPTISDYRHERLCEAIDQGYYFLQYHLYCLALHLYLKNRLPGYRYQRHFGGIFYIFLRGVRQDLGPGHGIFHDRPAASLVEGFAETLVPGYGHTEFREASI